MPTIDEHCDNIIFERSHAGPSSYKLPPLVSCYFSGTHYLTSPIQHSSSFGHGLAAFGKNVERVCPQFLDFITRHTNLL